MGPGSPDLLLVSGLPRGTCQPPTSCSLPVSPEGPDCPQPPARFRSPQRDLAAPTTSLLMAPLALHLGLPGAIPAIPAIPGNANNSRKTPFPIPGKPGTPYPWPGLGLKTIPHHPVHPFCSSCALWLRPRPISMKNGQDGLEPSKNGCSDDVFLVETMPHGYCRLSCDDAQTQTGHARQCGTCVLHWRTTVSQPANETKPHTQGMAIAQ